jgi:hypothetical protein
MVQDTQSALECSVFKPLFKRSHWMGAMGAARQRFRQQMDIEVEVRQFVSKLCAELSAAPADKIYKSNTAAEDFDEVEIYHFEYPPLVEVNGFVQKAYVEGSHLDDRECALVIQAGVEYLDDFTMVSATKLQAWTGISGGKIRLLYRKAKRLMEEFHWRNRREIAEIWEIRRAAKMTLA